MCVVRLFSTCFKFSELLYSYLSIYLSIYLYIYIYIHTCMKATTVLCYRCVWWGGVMYSFRAVDVVFVVGGSGG